MTHIYDEIREQPTTIEVKDYSPLSRVHESILKSHSILKIVKTMLDRGDSKETIREIIDFLETKQEKLCDFNL